MKSKFLVCACFVVLALAAAGLAWADECPTGGNFPAQNEAACTEVGGTFTQTGGLKKCVVTEPAQRVTCEQPENHPFSADISASTTTYTRQGNVCTTESTPGEILACYNGQRNQVSVNACADKGCL
jgi:hypothetical protein